MGGVRGRKPTAYSRCRHRASHYRFYHRAYYSRGECLGIDFPHVTFILGLTPIECVYFFSYIFWARHSLCSTKWPAEFLCLCNFGLRHLCLQVYKCKSTNQLRRAFIESKK